MQEYTLLLNACEKRVQYLIADEDTLLFAEETEPQKGGTDYLIASIENACKRLDIEAKQLTKIASLAGPGNFMGIRLTATISAGLARANNVMQASISYMQALAQSVYAKENEIIHIITTGTKDLVHSQCFKYQNGIALPINELRLIPYSTLSEIECAYMLGSGIRSEKLQKELIAKSTTLLPEQFDTPSIQALFTLLQNATWQKEDIAPLYLKECDAIQNLNHIAKEQGRNPEDSHKELTRLLNA